MDINQTNSDDADFQMDIPTDMYIETDSGISIYLKDYGEGKPVILIHGWPLSGEMWEYQIETLVNAGLRSRRRSLIERYPDRSEEQIDEELGFIDADAAQRAPTFGLGGGGA